jgi:hypothetical protein
MQIAKHLAINYSTAKAIAKENRSLFKERQTSNSEHEEEYLPSRNKKVKVQKVENPRCSYRTIDESAEGVPSKIQIITTVSWNFFKCGLPT